jgi:hypothetical protein
VRDVEPCLRAYASPWSSLSSWSPYFPMGVRCKPLCMHMDWMSGRWEARRDRAGAHCEQVHQALVETGKLDLVHVPADELRVKGRNTIAWMGLAMMVSTRLWLAGSVSLTRDKWLADALMQQVRRTAQRLRPLLVLTDGWAAYVRRVGVYEIPVRHGRGREQEPLGQELTRRGNSMATVACS